MNLFDAAVYLCLLVAVVVGFNSGLLRSLATILLVTGTIFDALLRRAVADLVGTEVNILDRMAGAVLGAVRIGLLAVMMVLIFDRIIPANSQPFFLAGSQLRPILSVAGRQGLKSLPPDVAIYIDRLKRERGL
jgi:membrane protein required for colicin V production